MNEDNEIAKALTDRSKAAASYLDIVGWTQVELKNASGEVCETGAVMYCRPQVGDEHIIVEVLRYRERAEDWNDAKGRTKEEVQAELSKDITDAELESTFGPQWEAIVAFVRRAAALTGDEVSRLNSARDSAWDSASDAARGAAWDAARGAARDSAWDSASDAVWVAAWGAARVAASDSAEALTIRDLINDEDFTQEHYDTVTEAWATTIGKVHPADPDRLAPQEPLRNGKDA